MKKKLESNPLNDLFHSAIPTRKHRDSEDETEAELDPESKKLEEKKRARYEALKEKYGNEY